MNKHFFVIDGVRHRGDVRSLIRSVDAYLTKFPTQQAAWIARPDQAPFLESRQVLSTANESDDYQRTVVQCITDASRNGAAGSVFHVLSYNTNVLSAAAAMNDASRVVATEYLGILRDGGYGAAPWPKAAPASPSHGVFSLSEAADLAKRVLRDGGHTSRETAMHQPRLRLAMGREDTRARRVQSDPSTWSLIRLLVAQGQSEGWLQQERRGPTGYEYVWLTETPAPASAPSSHGIATEPVSEVAQPPKQPTELPSECPARRRELVMEDVLRADRIGSPPVPRRHVFDAVERLTTDATQRKMTVAELQALVCTKAKEGAAAAGYLKDQNWSAVCECVFRAMVQAQVMLRPDGTPVPAKIGQHSSVVGSLAENFRQRTEALMVERIIDRLGDVRFAETYSLGLALYQQGRENLVSRENLLAQIDGLLVFLQSKERIEVKPDDLIVATYR